MMNDQFIKIQFPDGKQQQYERGVTLTDIAHSISPSLSKKTIVGYVNGIPTDVARPITEDAQISLYDAASKEGIAVVRHSTAHLLAHALKRIYPSIHFGVGPVIEDGFYYDVELDSPITPSDLPQIEKVMKQIINENVEINRKEVSREKAKQLFAHDPLKLELIEDIPQDEPVTVYEQGDFYDLCRGPHIPFTGKIQHFKLTKVSGAYWRGDSNNKMLQRIYGVAFATKDELRDYFVFLEEAEKRNHRKLGKELELFMFSEEAPGMPFYLANGQIIRNELESFLRNLQAEYDYKDVRTPLMMNQRLWEQSGHWDHYKENMYFTQVDEQSFALNGLLRVRSFCQDDAHIFVTPEQIEDEITLALKIIDHVYKVFGFEYEIELSTRPDNSMGSEELWNRAETALENVLNNLGYTYKINEGDGAFYGPKIDIHIKDAIQRSHQCATVQLDFQLPEKFDLTYIDKQNEKARPVVIHRAVFGSIDRFLGILIEHFAGAFPVWLAPTQVQIVPVSQVHLDYCFKIQSQLRQLGVRVKIDDDEEKLGYKIRRAQMQKIPYIIVLGDEELKENTVNVRKHGEKQSIRLPFKDFKENIVKQINERSI